MTLKDRGSKKWTSIMLPEHVEAIKRVFEEEEKEKKPILDEQQKIKNDVVIKNALEIGVPITIKHFKNGKRRTTSGYIDYIDHIEGKLFIEGINIDLNDILYVDFL